MNRLIRNLEEYIRETLDVVIDVKIWIGAEKLPFYLRDRYAFYQTDLLNRQFLIMVARERNEQTPATILKHLLTAEHLWDGEALFVDQQVTAYNRKRLIEHKVPFVIPGNQMYLPSLAADLREYFRTSRKISTQFSPSTQTVVLNALLNNYKSPYTPTKLSYQLGYTPMTLTRAFDELKTCGVGEVKVEGRGRMLYFEDNREGLWNKAKGFMRNPVKKRLRIKPLKFLFPGVTAGLTALAKYTLLTEPMQETFAFSLEEWKIQRQQNEIIEVPLNEIEAYQVEIWRYEPRMFAQNDVVDRFSLYLSLKEDDDERVQSALNELLENAKW
ncbi:MAG: hypothetical protein P9X24_11350 [Candidatus Hatepunaea meridiana]|nr:hypothetical protein [Candidatus Hatepunaea meridiana]